MRETTSPGSASGGGDVVALVAAFEAGDELGIRRLDWYSVWEACATWWAPRQTATAREMVVYAKLLGGEDPAAVLEALRDLCGDWRPTPAQVRAHLHRRPAEQANAGRNRDRAGTAEALRAVAEALRAGEAGCTCDHRRSTWYCDAAFVLRCRECRGLEHGQVYAVEDAGLIAAEAA